MLVLILQKIALLNVNEISFGRLNFVYINLNQFDDVVNKTNNSGWESIKTLKKVHLSLQFQVLRVNTNMGTGDHTPIDRSAEMTRDE